MHKEGSIEGNAVVCLSRGLASLVREGRTVGRVVGIAKALCRVLEGELARGGRAPRFWGRLIATVKDGHPVGPMKLPVAEPQVRPGRRGEAFKRRRCARTGVAR